MLTIIKGVAKIRTLLGDLSIKNRDTAIAWLHLRSIVNSKDIGERLTAEATRHLEEKCDECEVQEASDGMKVQRVVPTIKVWNKSEQVDKAMLAVEKASERLKEAQEKLNKAREKAGFTEKEGNAFYKIIK